MMRTISRIGLCILLGSGYLLWSWLGRMGPKSPTKPNIVFILADDLGWSDIGYNNPHVISPTLDSLAREGIILNQSYASQSCSPSRSALMSGYYSYRLGFQAGGVRCKMPRGLQLNLTLLPRKLQQLGYTTYMVGKWHLGFCKKEYTPTMRGFDKFYGYYLAGGDHFTHRSHPIINGGLDLHDQFETDWGQNGTYSSYLYSDKAVDFIEDHDTSKPLFMYLAYQSIHSPLQVPQKYFDMYPEVKNLNRRILLGMITAMDEGIAKVVEALRQNDLWKNTILIFMSDNGAPQNEKFEGNNWPLLGTKQTLYEGGTRVVGFLHSNRLQKKKYTYNGMMHIVDWYPTLVRAAGGKISDREMDGVDMWRALSTNAASPRKELVYNIIDDWNLASIRYGDFKLMHGPSPHPNDLCWVPPPETDGKLGEKTCMNPHSGDVQLFNLKVDPLEQFNLADEMPEKVAELMARLKERRKQAVPAFERSEVSEEADPENFGGMWSPGWC